MPPEKGGIFILPDLLSFPGTAAAQLLPEWAAPQDTPVLSGWAALQVPEYRNLPDRRTRQDEWAGQAERAGKT